MTELEPRSGPDNRTLYVSREAEKGSDGPFYVVYADEAGERRWGFHCANCGSFDTAMDSMGRIQCNDCSNYHKAEEWDAAHE
jgi:hypothetical protein